MRARLLGTIVLGVGCYSGASPGGASEGSSSSSGSSGGGSGATTTSTTSTTSGEATTSGATSTVGVSASSTGSSGDGTTGIAGSSSGPPPDLPPPPAPAVHYVGRHDASDPAHVRMGWSGVGLVVRLLGTGASVTLDDKARYFTVVVDGVVQDPPLATAPGEQTYPLATGLAMGEHTIELYRRTEGSFGPTVVLGVQVEGELLPPATVTRRIEVIGDSITCGYGNEGVSPCNFSAETENHYRTYGAFAARAVGAEIHTVAWSGKGVVYNYGDDKNEPLPQIYDRLLATSGDPWDFSWQPDAVVINLGTNDFSTSDDPPEGLFVPAYVDFLAHLRMVYPAAYILAVAPSLFGTDAATAEGYIQSAVDQRHAAGDAAVGFADINVKWLGSGCDGHPDAATHEAMGAKLTAELQARLGW